MLTKILTKIMHYFFLPKTVKAKLASLDSTWNDQVRKLIFNYLTQGDPKILALSDHELILGTTELIYEDLMRAKGKQLPMAQRQAPVQQQEHVKVVPGKKVFH